ncbi:VIT1/CCC1 family protein [Candidatus Marsarchaeota archaeon]|nr:VIT1/CCC1 family protein [Candidatus Marsarchaeota archaeon]
MQKKSAREREFDFLKDEISDFTLYSSIYRSEKNPETKKLVRKLKDTELKHTKIWASILGVRAGSVSLGALTRLKIWLYVLGRRLFGIAFVTKLLERNERLGLQEYKNAIKSVKFEESTMEKVREIIRDEEEHESMLLEETQKHEGRLNYTRSIIFGMNDGLVEILAVIAGLAMIATSSLIVALTGIIVGVSGTLSMAAGAYISSKSERVMQESLEETSTIYVLPTNEAYYTGIFYFAGALVATYPFILGFSGYAGIAISVVSVAIVLSIASSMIALISDTSIKRRVGEMLVLSLGTAFVTALIGFIVRVVFGIAISA